MGMALTRDMYPAWIYIGMISPTLIASISTSLPITPTLYFQLRTSFLIQIHMPTAYATSLSVYFVGTSLLNIFKTELEACYSCSVLSHRQKPRSFL